MKTITLDGIEIESVSYTTVDDMIKESKKVKVTKEEINEWLATRSEEELGSEWYAELHPESVIRKTHNKELADECKFKTKSKTCKYKNYWEKCASCKKESSR